jgi:hypothetical protein
LPNCILYTELFSSSTVVNDNHHLVSAGSLRALWHLGGSSPGRLIGAEIPFQCSALGTHQSAAFCCVRGHCGLPGNEAAVAAAKTPAVHGVLVLISRQWRLHLLSSRYFILVIDAVIMLRETNWVWWNHLCSSGNLSELSGRRRSYWHASGSVTRVAHRHLLRGETLWCPSWRTARVTPKTARVRHFHSAFSDIAGDDPV